jgi:hypothetical protein
LETIYEQLKLNKEAGLGRRLVLAGIKPDVDTNDSTVFIVLAKTGVVEALNLAKTLSFQAEILNLNLHFRPERVAVC